MNKKSDFFKDFNSEFLIRDIQVSELLPFKEMLLDFYAEISHSFSPNNLDEIILEFLEKGIVIVALNLSSNKIIGFICVIESNALYAGGNFGVINELYIIPEFRSRKIGQKLIDFLIEIAKKKNWSRLELDTPEIEKSEKTIQFYKKAGFVPIGFRMKKNII